MEAYLYPKTSPRSLVHSMKMC